MNRRERSVDNPRDPPGNSRAKKSSSAEPFNSSLSSTSSCSRKKSKFAFWTNLSFWPKPAVQPMKAPSGGSNGASSFPSPPGEDNLEQDLGSSYESVNSIATTTSFAFVSPKKLPKGRRIPVDDEGGSSRTLPGQHRTREGCSGGTLTRLGLKKKYGLQSCESLEHVESRGGTLQRRRARLHAAYSNYEIPSTSGGFASDTGTLTGTDTAQRKRKAPPVPLPVQKVSSIKVCAESTPQSPLQEEARSTSHTTLAEPRNSPELARPFPHPIPVPSCSSTSSNNVELLKVTSLAGGSSSTKLGRVPSKRESYPGMLALHRKGRLNCACSTSIFASHSRRAKVPCGSDHCVHKKVVHVKGKKKAPAPPNPFGDPDTPDQNASVQKKKVPRNPFYEDPEESTPPNIGEGAQSISTFNPGEVASAPENPSGVTQSSENAEESSCGENSSVSIGPSVFPGNSPYSDPAATASNAISVARLSERSESLVDTPVLSSSSQSAAKSTSVPVYKPFSSSNTKISNSGHAASPHVASSSVLATRSNTIQTSEIPRSATNVISSSIDTTASSAGQSSSSGVIYATIAITTPSTGISISSSATTLTTATTTAPGSVPSVTANTTASSTSNIVINVGSASTELNSTSSSTQPRISSATSTSSSPVAVSTSTAPSPSRNSSASIFTFISYVPEVSASQDGTSCAPTAIATTTISPVTSTSTPVTATSSAISPSSPGVSASISSPGHQPVSPTTFSPEALALAEEIAQNLLNDEQERQLLQESSASVSSPSTKTKSPRGSIFNFSRTPKKSSSTNSNTGDLESLLHSSHTLRAQVTAVDQQVRAHLVEESPPVSPGEGRAHKDKSPMFFFSTKSSRKSLPPSTIEEVPSPGGNSSAASTPHPFFNGGDSVNSPGTTPKVTLRPWYKRLSGGGSSGASSRPKPSVILLPKFSDLDREATRIVEENKRRSAELAFNANARTLIDIFNETFEPLTPLSPPPAEELESETPRETPDQQAKLSFLPSTVVSTSSPSSSSSAANQTETTPSSIAYSTVSSSQSGLFASTASPTPSSGAIPKTSVASASPASSTVVVSKGSAGKRRRESSSLASAASSVPLSAVPSASSALNSNSASKTSTPTAKLITSGSLFTSTTTATTTVASSSSNTATSPVVSSPACKSAKLTSTPTSPSHSSEEPRSIAVVQPQAKQPPVSTKSSSVATTSPSLNSSFVVSSRQSTAVPTSTPTASSVVVSSSRSSTATTTLSQATPSSPVSSPGEDWSCPRCTLKNTYWRALCEACYFRRDSGASTTLSSSMSAILQQVNSNRTPPPTSVTTTTSPSAPSVTTSTAKPTQAVKPKTSSAPACENFLSQLPPKEIPGKHDADKNKLLQQNSSVGVRLVEDPEVEELSLERLRRARLAFFQKDQEQKASQLASSERKPPAGPSLGKKNNLTTPSNSTSTSCVPKHSINVFDDGEDSFLDNCTRLVTPSTFIGNIPPCFPGPSSSSPSPGGWRPLLAPITEADANLYCLSEWDRIYENWELPSDDSPQRPATVSGPLPTSDSHSPNFLASALTTNTLSEVEDESVLEMERTRKHRTHNSHNKSAGGGGAMGGGVGDLFAVEENERGVAALLRKLEWAIGAGEHRLAASLAHDLALLKVKVAALGPATPTDPITIRVYVEDRFMQQGPFLVQVWESMRVSELKAKIESDWGIPVHFQKWILGQQMAEGDITPLASFNLKNNSLAFLYLVTPNINQKPPSILPPPVPAKVPQIPATGFPKGSQSGGASTAATPKEVHLQNGHGVSSDTFTKPSGSKSPSKMGLVSSHITSGSIKSTASGTSTQAPAPSLSPVVTNGHEPSEVAGSVKPASAVNVKAAPKAQEKSESSSETKQKQLSTNLTVPNGSRNKVTRNESTEIAVSTENKVSNSAKPQETIVKRDPVNSVASVKLSPKIARNKVEEKTASVAVGNDQPSATPAKQTQPPKILTTAQPPRTASPKRIASEEQSVQQGNVSGGPTKSIPLKENVPNTTPASVSLKKDDTSRERSDSDSFKEQKVSPVGESAGTAKELAAGSARGKSNSLQQKLAHLRQAAEQAFGKTFGTSSQPTASNSANNKVNTASSPAPDVTVTPKPPTAKENDPRPKPRVKKVDQHSKTMFSVLQKEESSSSGGEEYSSRSNSSKSNLRGKVRIQNPVDGCCQTTLEFPKTKAAGVIAEKTNKSPEAPKPSSPSDERGFSPAELEDIRMHIPSPVEQFESKPNSPEPPASPTTSALPAGCTSKPPKPKTLKTEEAINSSVSPVLTPNCPKPKPLITSTSPSPIPLNTEELKKSPVALDETLNLPKPSQAPVKSETPPDQPIGAQETPATSFGVLPVSTSITQASTTEEKSLSTRAESSSSADSPPTAAAEPVAATPPLAPAFKSHLPPVILRATKPPPGPPVHPSSNGLPGRPHFLNNRRVSQIEIPPQFKQATAVPSPTPIKKGLSSFPAYSGSKTSFNQSPKPFGSTYSKEPEKKSLLQRKNSDSSIANLVLDQNEDLSFLGAAALPPPNSEKKESNVDTYMRMLEDLEKLDLIPSAEPFDCSVCFLPVGPGEGVTLRDCLHNFCRECLVGAVKYADISTVGCPFRDDSYSCSSTLQEREIKALVPPDVFEAYLARSVKLAERVMTNTFHCRTSDCPGWCIFEDDVNSFLCPVCKNRNCLTCQAIHEDMDCRQYQRQLAIAAETDEDAKSSRLMLETMIERGEALDCPACHVVLLKKWGCDWVRCSYCKTEICWVTKGFRWGPGGKGDNSGGCKCGVNGVRCHPKCTYCH